MRVVAACCLTVVMLSAPRAAELREPGSGVLQRSLTRDALDLYLKGDYRSALQGRIPLARFDFAEADRWIAAGGPASADRRRIAAALFVLEYAGGRPSLLPALFTWARALLERHPSRPVEALWLRASIALAEGLDRWVFLAANVPGRPVAKPGPPLPSHIAFARSRFPDDPYLRMADAVAAELSATRPLDQLTGPVAQSGTGWDRLALEMLESGGPTVAQRSAALDRAAGLLDALTAHGDLGAEAHLRLGCVRLRQGRRDDALVHFDQVLALTKVDRWRYVAHVYSGWVLGGWGRIDEAASAYRAALRVVPRAQSASALLVAMFVRHDRLAEAEVEADEFLDAAATPDDPLRRYFLGDFPAYATLVIRLREHLR